MKRIFSLILLLSLLALPASGLPETILWEDENGVVILGDDGAIGFSPLTPTPAPDAQQTPFPAPPTPAPEGTAQAENDFVYKRKLQYGDSGALVEALQSRLLELGFYEARVSGGFYSVTQAAVKAFQAHNGLSVDGVAGRETQ